jgi:hypothetical protein
VRGLEVRLKTITCNERSIVLHSDNQLLHDMLVKATHELHPHTNLVQIQVTIDQYQSCQLFQKYWKELFIIN